MKRTGSITLLMFAVLVGGCAAQPQSQRYDEQLVLSFPPDSSRLADQQIADLTALVGRLGRNCARSPPGLAVIAIGALERGGVSESLALARAQSIRDVLEVRIPREAVMFFPESIKEGREPSPEAGREIPSNSAITILSCPKK